MKTIQKQKKYFSMLAQSFLFTGIDERETRFAFENEECRCMSFEAGEKIYTRNSFHKSIGMVLSGQLKAVKSSSEKGGLVLNTFFTGGVFGVACLFHPARQYVSEVTAVKRSKVMFLSQSLLQQLFRRDCRIAENYISYLSGRICFLNSRIDYFIGGNVEYRLASFLLTLSSQSGDPLEVSLPCTLSKLANMLDMGRASLYRAFDALIADGLIRRAEKTIFILDLDRLKSGQFHEEHEITD